jgi:hypothetical protein
VRQPGLQAASVSVRCRGAGLLLWRLTVFNHEKRVIYMYIYTSHSESVSVCMYIYSGRILVQHKFGLMMFVLFWGLGGVMC